MNMYTCAKFDPDRSSGSEAFPYLWIDDSLTPHAPRVSRGYFLAHVHSQMNMHMCAKFGPDRYSCLAYLPHVVWWPPNPLQKPLGARYVNLFSLFPFPDESVYVCQVGPDWSRGLEAFPYVCIGDPLTHMPLGYQGVTCYLMSIPRWLCIRVPKLFPIGPALWHLSHILEFVSHWAPLNAYCGSRG